MTYPLGRLYPGLKPPSSMPLFTQELQALVQTALSVNDPSAELQSYVQTYSRRLEDYRRRCEVLQLPVSLHDCHARLKQLVAKIKESPASDKNALLPLFCPAHSIDPDVAEEEKTFFFRAAVHLLAMVDCNSLSGGHWTDQETFESFLIRVFPHDIKASDAFPSPTSDQRMLSAYRLIKDAHISIQPTDNLAEHLVYDQPAKTVSVFLHTGFLHSLLKNNVENSDMHDALQKRQNLPRQLLLETLMTISIIFPSGDTKSYEWLEKLVARNPMLLDKDCLLPGSREVSLDQDDDLRYHYFGKRLAILHHLALNPAPKNKWMAWIGRHTSESSAINIAIIALCLNVVFGLMTVIIGIIQLDVGYKQVELARQQLAQGQQLRTP